jgi:dTDP-4-dehydrorhamnose reductase
MLGRECLAVLSESGLQLSATTRSLADVPENLRRRFVEFDAVRDSLQSTVGDLGPGDYVINCIGIIKPYIDDADAASRLRAIRINAEFPYELSGLAETQGFRVIQIATDCVYAGSTGHYAESAFHDALDVYGKSKSLGEVPSPAVVNLRCSIIGREGKGKLSLLEWVLSHENGDRITGYPDHLWNGLTTNAFARIALGIVSTGNTLSGSYHVIPADTVSKYDLCKIILDAFGRTAVSVDRVNSPSPIDRTLTTEFDSINRRLWQDGGYVTPPEIAQMVNDLTGVQPARNREDTE